MHTCTHSTLHILSNFFLCIHAKVIRVLCYPIRVGRWTCGRERQKDQSSSLDYLLVLHSLYVINWCNFPASHSVHRLSRCHRRCAGLPVAASGRHADCIDATAPRCAFGSRQFNWRAAVSRVIRPLISIPFLFFFLLIILLPLFSCVILHQCKSWTTWVSAHFVICMTESKSPKKYFDHNSTE